MSGRFALLTLPSLRVTSNTDKCVLQLCFLCFYLLTHHDTLRPLMKMASHAFSFFPWSFEKADGLNLTAQKWEHDMFQVLISS